MDRRRPPNEARFRGSLEKQRRNLKLQLHFYDEEKDEADWAKYKYIFDAPPAPAPPAPPAPPAAAGIAPPPPAAPVAEGEGAGGGAAPQNPVLAPAPAQE